MANRTSRPALRPVESIVVPDARHGNLLVLRDTQGVTDAQATIPPALVPIVARFTGASTCEQIARDVSLELGEQVPVELVVKLADELERGLFLEGRTFRDALADIARQFAEASVRTASHAGGAYLAEPKELRAYLDEKCLRAANGVAAKALQAGHIRALVAPHIDPWRGAVGYGHAYGALAAALAPEADTFILFGTSHAPMRQPFALCRKAFATPLGPLEADTAAIDAIADAAPFDAYADQLNHKREHSLEFQVVFLRHLLDLRDRRDANGEAAGRARSGARRRPATIVPILAGLGEHQAHGTDPGGDAAVDRFLDAVRAVVDARPGRVVLVAGADMAHVGPRFGDARPSPRALVTLDATDRTSLGHAARADASGFWKDVAKDLDTRRVCGLAPIYSLLRTMPAGARGELLHYEQTVDRDDGSVVSHAALAYFA
jgi:predicted class III extradiol MEMO1 family dioxygenase